MNYPNLKEGDFPPIELKKYIKEIFLNTEFISIYMSEEIKKNFKEFSINCSFEEIDGNLSVDCVVVDNQNRATVDRWNKTFNKNVIKKE